MDGETATDTAIEPARRKRMPNDDAVPTTRGNGVGSNNLNVADTDITAMQEHALSLLSFERQDYARTKDAEWPLWSTTHVFSEKRKIWIVSWTNCQSLYVYGNMTLADMNRLCNIPERTLEHASSRYGWRGARSTYRLARDMQLQELNMGELQDEGRKAAIKTYIGTAGLRLINQVMEALAAKPNEINALNAAPLLQVGMKAIGMGEEMVTEYRHSKVDNPNAAPPATTTNVAIIGAGQTMDSVMDMLAKRLAALGQLSLPPTAPVDTTAKTAQ